MPIYLTKEAKIDAAIGLLIVHHLLCVLLIVCLAVNLAIDVPVDCVAWMAMTTAITQS